MKRIVCVMLVLMLCVGFAACGKGKSTKDSAKKFSSIEAYLADPAVAAGIDEANGENEDVEVDVYADGDTLVYDYTYTTHFEDDQIPALKTQLDTALEDESNAEAFGSVVTELKSKVEADNPKVKVIYRNDDGTEITSKVFE